jgi:flagellar motor switch/type III secretory pathway protein FliN
MVETPHERAEGARTADLARRDFDALPITLSARVATGHATLAALRALTPGQVVPLSTPIGDPCRLVADGVEIGAGEIAEIRGRLALRLTRLGHDLG